MIFTVASFASAYAPDAGLLIAARFIQGIGGAMLFATSLAIVTQVYGPGERGWALGITVATVYAGLSIGPFLGGIITDHFGWPAIFLINVPIGIATIALTLWGVHDEWADAAGERFDLAGSVIYGVMLSCGLYGLTRLPDPDGTGWLLLGIGAFALFVWWEGRASSPILDPALFYGNRTFSFSCIAAMINYGATFAVAFLLSLYLQYIRGFSAGTAGLILVAQPVVQTLLSPIAGRISDRIEPRYVSTAGMAITTIGLSFFIFLDPATPLGAIIISLVVLGTGYALFSSPNMNAIMSSVDNQDLGIASSIVATMRYLGQVLSMAIAMFCFSLYLGTLTITPPVYPLLLASIHTAFLIFTVLCILGVGSSYVRGTIHQP
jgi:EmrB/QacA subfamily drug resistance transporter